MATDAQPRRLLTWREYLEQEVAERREREARLADGANRLVRWAAQGGSEEDVPDEVFRAIQVMRDDERSDDEADDEADDAEMAVDDAELGEDRHGGGMARLTSEIEQLRASWFEAREENERFQREANADRRQMGEMQRNYEWHVRNHMAREGQSLRAGARIARWVVQRCVAENVPVPAELRGDIALVHDDEINGDRALVQDDEAEGDVGMLVPDAVP
jgi:hypothetical protein